MKKLPIGKQDFCSLIKEDCIYVDKTEYLHKLITTGFYYFLSRPRRFGKSLLVSTLKEIFLGNKELFKDLWIYDKIEWVKHPVIYIDFAELDYKDQLLNEAIILHLNKIAKNYEIDLAGFISANLKDRFIELITILSKKNKVVILIDEYDKPIIDYLDNIPQAEKNRQTLKNFYSVLKPLDAYLKFVFITGVSKFSQVSIFSDLNHLTDITYNRQYAKMLGYTEEDLIKYFSEYKSELCKIFLSEGSEIDEKIKKWYNGYSWDGENFVYNPFSVLNLFSNYRFGDYWFRTGTPSFLLKLLKTNNYPVSSLSNLTINQNLVDSYEIDKIDITVLLLQTGYLTIKTQDIYKNTITLDFPNYEVESSFLNYLFADYIEKGYTQNSTVISMLEQSLENNDIKEFILILISLFANITYEQVKIEESYFHSVFYLIIKMLGFNIDCEIQTNIGRIDAVVKTTKYIYVIEFKMSSAEIALQQIKDKKYFQKYYLEKKQIILLGIGFSKEEKNIHDWKSEIMEQ